VGFHSLVDSRTPLWNSNFRGLPLIKEKKMIETQSASVFRLPNLTASSAWLSVLVDLTAEPGLAHDLFSPDI